jgi:hypothetical protein
MKPTCRLHVSEAFNIPFGDTRIFVPAFANSNNQTKKAWKCFAMAVF